MSRQPDTPVFLQRDSYRQRRLRDGAKLVPFLGIILLVIPLAWSADAPDEKIGASGLIYVFGVWMVLIILTAILARYMRPEGTDKAEDRPEV
jgi:hypothetical protein